MSGYPVSLGVIGGSGVYEMDQAKVVAVHDVNTPYGRPSDLITEVEVDSRRAFFLPRHGRGHRLLPSEVNYCANIYALKSLGVSHLLAVSAVGILQDNIHPGDMVIPDQMFDRTKGVRRSSFFGDGVVGHVEFADPFDSEFLDLLRSASMRQTEKVHSGGAYVCIEGPQFSTRAESKNYRANIEKAAVIGMTGLPEAKLAREAEMCYGMLALATDYDCWKEDAEDVSVESVLAVLKANSANAKAIVKNLLLDLPAESNSPNLSSAKHAIITDRSMIPEHRKQELRTLFGRYLD